MGRQRLNKLDHIEKANRLFESRNRRTIMEQSAGPTVEMFACVDCQMQSIGQVPTSELDDIGGNGSYYSKYNLIWDGVNYQNSAGGICDGQSDPGVIANVNQQFTPMLDGIINFPVVSDPYNTWYGGVGTAALCSMSGRTENPIDIDLPVTGTTLEGRFCCDLNSNSYGFGPDGVSVNIDGAVDMYVMENGPEGELCDESLCKPCDAAEMASYLSSFEPAPGISTMEFCAKCQTGSWDPFFGGSPEQCECCEPETDVDPEPIPDEGCNRLVSDPSHSACCTKCMAGSVTSDDDPCWPHCMCCGDYVGDTPTEGGYNCKTGLMGGGCVPCGPSGDCEFESLGACQNSGCEDDTKSKGNNKKTKQRKKPERLREEYTRMKTLWTYKF